MLTSYRDALRRGLREALQERLREEFYRAVNARGVPAVVFVDADRMAGALVPSGTYTVRDKKVVVNLALLRDRKRVKVLKPIEGSAAEADLPALVERLAREIHRAAREAPAN